MHQRKRRSTVIITLGIVVPAGCPDDPGNTEVWTIYDGHHALILNVGDDLAGFEVLGNVQSVEHGVIPTSAQGRGPLETGLFTFQVPVLTGADAASNLVYGLVSNTGERYPNYQQTVNVVSGTAYIPVTNPPSGKGQYPCQIQVIYQAEPGRAVVGNFRLNGIELPGTQLHDFQLSDWSVCGPNPPNP